MKTRSLLPAFCGLLVAISPPALATPALDKNEFAPPFSGAVNEVVKLTQAQVDQTVVLAYIKTSSGPFAPNADEIIRLHSLGISSEIVTAMLQRGGELRQQPSATAAYSYQQPSSPAPQTAATYAQPVYTPPATPAYADAGYASYPASYVYPGYNYYPYYSSYYYSPGYYYPYSRSCFYPRVGFCAPFFSPRLSFNAHFGGGFHSGGLHVSGGGFRGGFHGGFASVSHGGGHSGGGMHHR